MQRLCGAMTLMAAQSIEQNRGTDGYGDSEKPQLSLSYEAATNLIQLVGQVPQAVDRPCQVKEGKRTISYSARELIESAPGSLLAVELENTLEAAKKSAAPEEVVQQILFQEYSSCSDAQLRHVLNQAIVEANKRPIGGHVLFGRKMDNCVVDARVTRLADRYDFAPRAEVRGYKDATMPFRTVADIVSKLKMQPQTFVIKRLQEVRIRSQAGPVPRAETTPQTAPTDAETWKEILANPWGKMKSIFQ